MKGYKWFTLCACAVTIAMFVGGCSDDHEVNQTLTGAGYNTFSGTWVGTANFKIANPDPGTCASGEDTIVAPSQSTCRSLETKFGDM